MQNKGENEDQKSSSADDEKYKKMTETLLLDETDIQNLSYSDLRNLIDYLKSYQTVLIKQNHFQQAKQISDLRDKAISEFQFQTNQLNQYTQDKSTKKKKSRFDEDTENLERDLLQKQVQELKDFEEKWKDDDSHDSPDYKESKAQLEEKFRQEIEELRNSRQQQKQQMMNLYKSNQNENSKKTTGSRKSKSRRPLTSQGRPQSKRSTNSTNSRIKQQNSQTPDYSIYFPLYVWISKKKKEDSANDDDNETDNTNSASSKTKRKVDKNSQNASKSKNKKQIDKDSNDNDEQEGAALLLAEADEYSYDESGNKKPKNKSATSNEGELEKVVNNQALSLLGAKESKKNDFSDTSESIVSNNDLNSTMGPKLLMLAERQSSEDEEDEEDAASEGGSPDTNEK